jgi:hypothetical protein
MTLQSYEKYLFVNSARQLYLGQMIRFYGLVSVMSGECRHPPDLTPISTMKGILPHL